MGLAAIVNWPRRIRPDDSTSSAIEKLRSLAWPASQLDEAFYLLAHQSGLLSASVERQLSPPAADTWQDAGLEEWFDVAAAQLSIEVEPVGCLYTEVDELIGHVGPALLQLPVLRSGETEPYFVAALKCGWGWITVLGSNGTRYRVHPAMVRATVCQALEAPVLPEVERFLDHIDPPLWRRSRARHAMLRERLHDADINGVWLLRLSPGSSLWRQLQQVGVWKFFWLNVAGQAIAYATLLGSLALINNAVARGHLEWSPLLAGILIWLSGLPFFLLSDWVGSIFETRVAMLLKQRLFHGVLQLEPDEVQYQGIGQFLVWVLESEVLEQGALSRSASLLQAVVPLIMIAAALMMVGDLVVGGLLFGWLVLTGWWSWRMFQHYSTLNTYFIDMLTDALEKARGHQTRLVQENDWYDAEDQAVAHYLTLGQAYDRKNLLLWVVMPYGWIVIMLASITADFVAGPSSVAEATEGLRFAALLFGVFQFQFLGLILPDMAKSVAAWRLIAPIQQAASRHAAQKQPPPTVLEDVPVLERQRILDARGLTFRYQAGGRPILSGCDLEIYAGDRLLLEGPSGSGKSTLASLLIGLYTPESGLLLLNGLDRYTLNAETWRTRIVAAPQFHENHVLNASFAFNVLMGRRWPPHPADLVDAEIICRELGLGAVLDRMPLGLQQMLGDQGWRLSQGERSRLYIARALLQQADMIILDESFASLDPENMRMALQSVLHRASTLFVIAHP